MRVPPSRAVPKLPACPTLHSRAPEPGEDAKAQGDARAPGPGRWCASPVAGQPASAADSWRCPFIPRSTPGPAVLARRGPQARDRGHSEPEDGESCPPPSTGASRGATPNSSVSMNRAVVSDTTRPHGQTPGNPVQSLRTLGGPCAPAWRPGPSGWRTPDGGGRPAGTPCRRPRGRRARVPKP